MSYYRQERAPLSDVEQWWQ